MRLPVLAAFGLLLPLAACDSGAEPEALSPLLGTYTEQPGVLTTYVTVSQAQSALDYSRPGTGTLRVSGAASGELRYLTLRGEEGGETNIVSVGTAPLSRFGETSARFSVTTTGSATVETYDAFDTYARGSYVEGDTRPELFTITPDGVSANDARFLEDGTSAEVRVTGTLTFARQTLQAGTETLVLEDAFGPSTQFTRVMEFAEGGVLRSGYRGGAMRTGTWEIRPGNRLVTFYGSLEEMYTYTLNGSDLTLRQDDDAWAAEPGIEAGMERLLDLQPGTATASRREFTLRFRK